MEWIGCGFGNGNFSKVGTGINRCGSTSLGNGYMYPSYCFFQCFVSLLVLVWICIRGLAFYLNVKGDPGSQINAEP
jgi:hypothetical protein